MKKSKTQKTLHHQLAFLYGTERSDDLLSELNGILDHHRSQVVRQEYPYGEISEQDAILITYADQVQVNGTPSLKTLRSFLEDWVSGAISGVHILPFFPYSSDDGFAIIDYREVDPSLGSWDDLRATAREFRFMVDAVINHISSQSDWFHYYLTCHPKYSEYFITVDPDVNLSMVVRPRDLPLLTSVNTSQGDRSVWTTFSEDQIDLNYANPEVLLEIIDLLLFYIRQGARLIRLDAIAFLWKEIGTPCIHLPQTHSIIQLLRAVIDSVAPSVLLITETNVPHKENLSYLGDRTNEAHLVYQFALPPLVLHALLSGNSEHLSNWAAALRLPSDKVTFFNFLASHDGIGLRPVHNILSEEEIQLLLDRTEERGGKISYRVTSNGGHQPYELNINYLSALTPPGELENPSDLTVDRFIVSQAIMLSMVGLPGVYFHSLVGSLNWAEGVQITKRSRTINREKLQLRELEIELNDPQSLRSRIFHQYIQLLQGRRKSRAFDPYGLQTVLSIHPSIFYVMRASRDDCAYAICLHNLSAERQHPTLSVWDVLPSNVECLTDLLQEGKFYERNGEIQLDLDPYQVVWLASEDDTYT